jgi:hypothetical protein
VLGVVAAVTMSAALLMAPMAFGAGDPVSSGTFKLKLSGGFKKQLKKNHVKLKPAKFGLKGGSALDPTTGAGTLFLGKVTFKKGGKKYVVKNAKATLGASGGKGKLAGKAKGGVNVKLFSLKGGTLVRNGFGADLTGVKAKFLKGAAKKINKALGLHSLHPGSAGKASASEQPKTVQVTGGFVFVDIPISFLPATILPGSGADPNTVAAKQPSHCIGPAGGVHVIPGPDPSNPARVSTVTSTDPVLGPPPAGVAAHFRFPVVSGGTVGPAGNAGAFSVLGGVSLETGTSGTDTGLFPQPPSCAGEVQGPTTSHSILETTGLAPNLALGNVQSVVNFAGTQPGCNQTGQPATCPTAVFPGSKGTAIGQTIDLTGATVNADPTAKTVTVKGGLIKNNALTAQTLTGLFPDASGTHPWADGDKFGIPTLSVTTR